MTYAQQIGKAATHDELKAAGIKIYKAKLSKEKREELVKAYRARRRELDRAMLDNTTNKTLKSMLFAINTMAQEGVAQVARIGKEIYDLTKAGKFTRHEADLVFRAYRHQKSKADISFGEQAA
jgi:hypothetical protein